MFITALIYPKTYNIKYKYTKILINVNTEIFV